MLAKDLEHYDKKSLIDNFRDILDYLKFVFLPKYKYKKRIFGIDINIIRIAIFVVLAIIFALLIFQTRHSYFLEHGYYPIW